MRSANKRTRSIGVDFGLARIGLAYSDESKIIASPLALLKVDKKSKDTVKKTFDAIKGHEQELGYEVDTIVVGMPLMMSGRSGLMADEVTHFVEKLQELLPDTKIVTWDERLTSVQAERSLREAKMSRKKRTKHIDTVAAVIILQSYLDHLELQKDRLPPMPPMA